MSNRIKREKRVVELMIAIYCQGNHQSSDLCESCSDLRDYAFKRLLSCPFDEEKPVCSKCKLHCYNTNEELRILVIKLL